MRSAATGKFACCSLPRSNGPVPGQAKGVPWWCNR